MEEPVSRPSTTADSVASMAITILMASRDSSAHVLIGKDLPEEHPNHCAAEYDREDSDADKISFIRFSDLPAAVPDWPRPWSRFGRMLHRTHFPIR